MEYYIIGKNCRDKGKIREYYAIQNHGILDYWEKMLRQRQNQEGNQLIDRDRGGQWSSHSTTYNRHKINIIDKNVIKKKNVFHM